MRGAVPRVTGTHKVITTAQREVIRGKVEKIAATPGTRN
jgi:hypothetical protein